MSLEDTLAAIDTLTAACAQCNGPRGDSPSAVREARPIVTLLALTRTQQAVLDAITTHIRANGYPPTLRELSEATGLVSTSTVTHHLKTLQLAGYIRRVPGASRAIQVLTSADSP